MPTNADLYNPDHPEWALNAMVSQTERQLFQDILNLGFHDIVAEQLPHRPYTRWQHYRTASDRQRGFRLDYFFTPIDYLVMFKFLPIGGPCHIPVIMRQSRWS